MNFLALLWLPILLSAVIVFFASFVMHMLLTYHRSDYKKIPDEENAIAGLRTANLPVGVYMFPHCDHKEMKSPATQEKFKRGPVGIVNIFPNQAPNMGRYLGLWFAFLVVVSIFTAYLTYHTVPAGAHYLAVYRVAGTTAFMAYGVANLANSIWKAQPWSNTIKEVVDGLVYAGLTAGTFGWLWPK
jgi:hypothetical protein